MAEQEDLEETYQVVHLPLDSSPVWDQSPPNNEELLALIHEHQEEVQNISGLRIVYFNSKLQADHEHNEEWSKALCKPETGCLEAGTITEISTENDLVIVRVCWDCGVGKTYAPELWCYLRVYSLGPTGYLGQMVFCDKCLEPSKGLAFRLARKNENLGDLYDLCYKCYNEGEDEHLDSRFYCNIPSGNIDQKDRERKQFLPGRKQSSKYDIVGIFKDSIVEINSSEPSPTQQGQVLNIVHAGGQYDLRKASYYDSCAEIKLSSKSEKLPLVYKEAGSGGKVKLKAIKPGKAPSPMPVEHYPILGFEVIQEMLTYKGKLVKINKGKKNKSSCFMRFKDDGCYSLTISGTTLTSITDPTIWERCKDLKIVILFINELSNLPKELKQFSDTIELVCIQHNRFTEVPPVIFSLKHIKHLNLHGNEISKFPEEMKVFSNLERLKFGQNKLRSLPDIFESFAHNLIEITLNDNYLTRLPSSFAKLKQLESIDLRNNSYTCIPAPLLKLPKLKVLYMDWNRIQRLAPIEDHEGRETFELLRRLVSLRLSGNPVYEELSPRLDDSTNILTLVTDWIRFSELHQHPVYRALRVLVLGSCGAGKTSIVEALTFKKYVTPTSEAHHDHTVGIKQFSIPVRMKMKNGKEITTELRLWDFAGERSYIMMNSLFVTDGTLVWIAVNFQTYECTDESFHDNVTSWLQQVMTRSIRPVVWVIGTHTDKCTQEEVEKKLEDIKDRIEKKCKLFHTELQKELDKLNVIEKNCQYKNRSPDCVRQNIEELEKLTAKDVPCFIRDHLKVICLTNTHSFKGFGDLKDCIKSFPQYSAFENLTAPLTVSEQKAADKLRQETEEILASGEVPVLEDENVIKLIKHALGPDSSDKSAKRFLQYLYQAGHLLVCEPHSDIILDVDWLIDLLAQIFHHDFQAMVNEKKSTFISLNDDNIERAVSTQKAMGIVEKPLLEALWPLKVKIFNRLMQLLETYGLAYETSESPGPSGYLFPWLITKQCLEPSPLEKKNKQIVLSYNFSPCLPPCFLQQLVVKCKKHFSVNDVSIRSFTVSVPKHLNPQNQFDYAVLTVYVFVSPEKNKMCGKINLCACAQFNIETDSTLLIELWEILMTIIKEMEGLLCYWTFYGNLQRRVCCLYCLKPSWDLEIRECGNPERFDPHGNCMICRNETAPIYIRSPRKFLLSGFVDGHSTRLFSGLSPVLNPIAYAPHLEPVSGSPSVLTERHHSASLPVTNAETGEIVIGHSRWSSSHPPHLPSFQPSKKRTNTKLPMIEVEAAGNDEGQIFEMENEDLTASQNLSDGDDIPVQDTHPPRQ